MQKSIAELWPLSALPLSMGQFRPISPWKEGGTKAASTLSFTRVLMGWDHACKLILLADHNFMACSL